jgi:hypothetical protein
VLDRSFDAAFARLTEVVRAVEETPPETRKLLVPMPMLRYAVPAEGVASGRRLAQYATELSGVARPSGSKSLPAFTTSSLRDDFVWFDCMQLQRSALDVLIREISLNLGSEPYPQPEDAMPDWSRPQTPWPSSFTKAMGLFCSLVPAPVALSCRARTGSVQGSAHWD